MRPSEFRAVCQLLWGWPGAQWGADRAAVHLKVNVRNVYYWGAGAKPIPAGVVQDLETEIRRRLDDPADTTPGLALLRSACHLSGPGTQAA